MNKKEELRVKRMARNKKSFIFITILCMGIGFALLSSNLTITGNTNVSGNSWKVYFNSVSVTNGSVDATVTPTVTGTTTTSLNYTILLDKPGDFYEFTVEAKNDGTIDAVISSITEPNIASRVLQYLNYSVTYLDGSPVNEGDILKKKISTNYKVRVEYKTDIEATDLDSEGVILDLAFGVNYEQYTPVPSNFVKLVKRDALSDVNLDFSKISSASNGQGLYVMESTKNDTYPIYYYRGSVTDNNAKFAGVCWKIVRTTETGGTKLVYNGLPKIVYDNYHKFDGDEYTNVVNDETHPFTYDEANHRWENVAETGWSESTISFSIAEAGDYYLNYAVTMEEETWIDAIIYRDDEQIVRIGDSDAKVDFLRLENVTPSTTFRIVYMKSVYSDPESEESSVPNNDGIIFSIEKGIGESKEVCTNTTGYSTQIQTSRFSSGYNTIADIGYMRNKAYYENVNTSIGTEDYVFGSDFEFVDGAYVLTDSVTDTTQLNTHHYTCFNSTGTCDSLYYVYYWDGTAGTRAFYITLRNGESVEEAVEKMKNNKNNSLVKEVVDNWFANTFNNYFTNNNEDYNDYLEDTVWCNDRIFNTAGNEDILTKSGWNPNGGIISNYLRFAAFGRLEITRSPSLAVLIKMMRLQLWNHLQEMEH